MFPVDVLATSRELETARDMRMFGAKRREERCRASSACKEYCRPRREKPRTEDAKQQIPRPMVLKGNCTGSSPLNKNRSTK